MNSRRDNSSFAQPKFEWRNQVYVDEVSIANYQKLSPLIKTIYSEALVHEVQNLCQKKSCGYKTDHPSHRQHNCSIVTEDERWSLCCEEVKMIVDARVMAEFNEALRVLKLHLLVFISTKYTIIKANLKLINVKIYSFYSIGIHQILYATI